jgi:PAS domain S-box-containing protein
MEARSAETPAWTEHQRGEALRSYAIIDTMPEEIFEDIVQLASDLCETPIALISFVEEHRQWFKAEIGLGQQETPRAVAICAHALEHPGLFEVRDLSRDPRFSSNPLVTGETGLRYYAGARLVSSEGIPLGTLSVLDRKPRPRGLTSRQSRMLQALARQVMRELELRRTAAVQRHELHAIQELFEQAPIFLAMGSAPVLRFEYANRAYRELVGREDLVGRQLLEALPEIEGQSVMEALEAVLQTGSPHSGKNVAVDLCPRPGAKPIRRYVDFIYQPIRADNGQIRGVLCVGADVTEEYLAKQRAQRLEAELHRTLRLNAMGALAATLAHELNQPLTASINYLATARLLLGGKNLDLILEAQAIVVEAEQQLNRIADIIRGARGFIEKSSTGQRESSFKEVYARTRKLIDAAQVCPGMPLRASIEGPDRIYCNPVQIEQVLVNLVKNACEAMRGGDRAEVVIGARKASPDHLEIRIGDNGPGFTDEALERLFSGLAPSTTGGLGLGLSIAKTIVEGNGGRIWARNEPGGGASVLFTVPLAKGNHAGEG